MNTYLGNKGKQQKQCNRNSIQN